MRPIAGVEQASAELLSAETDLLVQPAVRYSGYGRLGPGR